MRELYLFVSFLIAFSPFSLSVYPTGRLHAADQRPGHLPRRPGLPDTSTQRVLKMWPQEDPTCELSNLQTARDTDTDRSFFLCQPIHFKPVHSNLWNEFQLHLEDW